MDKLIEEKTEKTVRKHIITCDNCNEEIVTSEEYDDGYYWQPAELEISVDGLKNELKYTRMLCDKCYIEIQNKIEKELCSLGFERDTELD